MSRWIERVNQHPLFETLTSVSALTDELSAAPENVSADVVESLNRIAMVVRYIDGLLRQVDPLLIVPSWLDQIKSSVDAVIGHLTQFRADRNPKLLLAANTNLDSALSQLSTVHGVSSPEAVEDLREASSSFRRACGQLTRNLEAEVEQTKSASNNLKSKLDEMTAEVTAQKQRLDTAITNFTQSFNEAQTTRGNEFAELKEKARKEVTMEISAFRESVDGLMSESNSTIKELFERIEKEHRTHKESTGEQADRLLQELQGRLDEAQRLVGIISMTGMVGGYQRVANDERNAFVRWRRGAVGSMLLLTSFAIYTFGTAASMHFDAGQFANRLFVTVTLAVLAGYAAVQADRHRRAEISNRQMELELASFDPFLASLSDEERNSLKRDLADRVFGRKPPPHTRIGSGVLS